MRYLTFLAKLRATTFLSSHLFHLPPSAWIYSQLKVEAEKLKLSVDIETRGGHIACIGLAWSDTEAICIPLMRTAW
jgi:hypothetical protein